MRLNIRALTITSSLLWGGLIFLVGFAHWMIPSYGEAFLLLASSLYPGYHLDAGFGSVIVGTLYGILDGAIGGAVFGYLYNRIIPKSV